MNLGINRSRKLTWARPIQFAVLALTLLATPVFGQDTAADKVAADKVATSQPDAKTKALHDKLAKYLGGTKWTGQFTMTGKDATRKEQYEILSASKNEVGDYWNLVARIKYGDHDQTLTLPPIEIKFAEKTPVITVDRVSFPGFGTFDARVLIRQGKYAGTWAHSGGGGGHLFGKIERMDEDEVKEKSQKVKAAEDKAKTEKPKSEEANDSDK